MTAPMKEMAPIRLGNLEVARVEEMIWTVSPRFLCPGIRNAAFEPYRDWLVPHFSTTRYWWRLSIHTFVVRTPHHTILVGTCVGNDRNRSVIPEWHRMHTDYPARLAAAGVVPDDVDYVLCTHLHADHVGWNTRLEDGRFVPTFPNAGTCSTAPSGNTGMTPGKRSTPKWSRTACCPSWMRGSPTWSRPIT